MGLFGKGIGEFPAERLHPVFHRDFKRISDGWHANEIFIKKADSSELPQSVLEFEVDDDQVETLFEYFPYATRIKEVSPDKYEGMLYYVDDGNNNSKSIIDYLESNGAKMKALDDTPKSSSHNQN